MKDSTPMTLEQLGLKIDGETPDYQLLASNIYSQLILETRANNSKYEGRINSETGMFQIEEEIRKNILETCHVNNYSDTQLAKVDFAIAIALYAHKDQYRESGPPYSTHFLGIALELAQEDTEAIDSETVVSAILHDTIEDTFLTYDNLLDLFGQKVADTVDSLTNYEGDIIRKSIIDEQERVRIISSLIDNPSVARIKIKDKKFNLREIDVKSRSKQLRSINEREEVFVPLARMIGAKNDAEEMMELCLKKRGKKTEKYLGERISDYQKFSDKNFKSDLAGQIQTITESRLKEAEIIVNSPSYKDIYDYGEFRPAVDIVINPESSSSDWKHRAVSFLVKIMDNSNVELLEKFDLDKALADIRDEDRNHFTIQIKINGNTNSHVDIRIYSKDTYAWQNSPLKDINLPAQSDNQNILDRRSASLKKQHVLATRLSSTINSDTRSTSILKEIEPNIPPGYIAIIGIDSNGNKEKWRVPAGTSAIGLAYDISPSNWHRSRSATINGKNVNLIHTLNSGDEVHIEFNNKSHWDPSWVFGFAEGTKGRSAIKKNIKRIEKAEESLSFQEMKQQILVLGKQRLESFMDETEKPLRVGPGKVIAFVHEIYKKDLTEDEFLLEIGRGNISDKIVAAVAKELTPINNRVGQICFTFLQSGSGQADAVTDILSEKFKINLLGVVAENITGSNSVINIFLDPDDASKIDEIIAIIKNKDRFKKLGLASVHQVFKNK